MRNTITAVKFHLQELQFSVITFIIDCIYEIDDEYNESSRSHAQ